jgi:hypothetical protein
MNREPSQHINRALELSAAALKKRQDIYLNKIGMSDNEIASAIYMLITEICELEKLAIYLLSANNPSTPPQS